MTQDTGHRVYSEVHTNEEGRRQGDRAVRAISAVKPHGSRGGAASCRAEAHAPEALADGGRGDIGGTSVASRSSGGSICPRSLIDIRLVVATDLNYSTGNACATVRLRGHALGKVEIIHDFTNDYIIRGNAFVLRVQDTAGCLGLDKKHR